MLRIWQPDKTITPILARYPAICRATLAGRADPYHFNCCVDRDFLKFSGIKAEEFEQFVASGATDSEVATWIGKTSRIQNPGRVAAWSLLMRLNPLLYALNFDDWIYSRKVQSGKLTS